MIVALSFDRACRCWHLVGFSWAGCPPLVQTDCWPVSRPSISVERFCLFYRTTASSATESSEIARMSELFVAPSKFWRISASWACSSALGGATSSGCTNSRILRVLKCDCQTWPVGNRLNWVSNSAADCLNTRRSGCQSNLAMSLGVGAGPRRR